MSHSTDQELPNRQRTSKPRDSAGWDGKLRVERRPVLVNPEALSDPEYSDQEAPPPEQIAADEDLLDDYPDDTDEIDLVHRRLSSLQSLQLSRFNRVEKLCLRENLISEIVFPDQIGYSLKDLDLYDNLIAHLRGLDNVPNLNSLDLSFNKLKHIKNIGHLKELTEVFFVQNRISKIEGLDGLIKLRNLELAANRIREIENLDSLRGLQELWLAKNKITELKNLSPLTNLKILSLQSNRLGTLQGVGSLCNLEELYVSHNLLTQIDGLDSTPKLRVIDISNNQISRVENISHLQNIEEFWASSNQISSFHDVERELGNKQNLSTVYFEGNPLQTDNRVMYRNKIRLSLPQVKQIDATFVQLH